MHVHAIRTFEEIIPFLLTYVDKGAITPKRGYWNIEHLEQAFRADEFRKWVDQFIRRNMGEIRGTEGYCSLGAMCASAYICELFSVPFRFIDYKGTNLPNTDDPCVEIWQSYELHEGTRELELWNLVALRSVNRTEIMIQPEALPYSYTFGSKTEPYQIKEPHFILLKETNSFGFFKNSGKEAIALAGRNHIIVPQSAGTRESASLGYLRRVGRSDLGQILQTLELQPQHWGKERA